MTSAPGVSALHHVLVLCDDIERSREFYERALGHAQRIGLTVPERAGGPGPVDHIAFVAPDYDVVCRRLERCGVDPIRNEVPGGGPRQLFFFDPDGARVEINVLANNPEV